MAKIIGASIPNIPWQDKPEGYKYPVWRYDGNPVITRDNLYNANSIFNSAVVPFKGGFAGVFRVDDVCRDHTLVVGYSDDAINWNLQEKVVDGDEYSSELEALIHKTIKKVSFDVDNLKANTAIAAMMTLVNEMAAKGCNKAELKTLTILLNPFAPHITEEMWQVLGFEGMVNQAKWPIYDEAKTVENAVEIAIQILGKVRSRMTISVDMSQADVIAAAKQDAKIAELLEGKTIKKEIYVPGKLVNFVAM